MTAAEALHEALFQFWTRQDPASTFRRDPVENVRYAQRADDPSSAKSLTQQGANRLASPAPPMLTATPAHRGERVWLQVVGGSLERGEFRLYWPIWREPASLRGPRTTSHPGFAAGPAALAI